MNVKTVIRLCLALFVGLTVMCSVPVQAEPNFPIPSVVGGATHLDTAPFILGSMQTRTIPFADNYDGSYWIWEVEIWNPTGSVIRATWQFLFRGANLGAYDITLPVGASFYKAWEVSESPPETGTWSLYTWNFDDSAWGEDTSIVEDAPFPQSGTRYTEDVEVLPIELGPGMSADCGVDIGPVVPEPGSLLALGTAMMALAGTAIRRRR